MELEDAIVLCARHGFGKVAVDTDPQRGVIVSPLATLAFKLRAVGETGLKTGWVRCRHGAGWGGAGWLRTSLIVSNHSTNRDS